METVLSLIKSYFILMVLLLVLSYLAPKDCYKKYFQFFIGIWVSILLLQPVISWMESGERLAHTAQEQIEARLDEIENWQGDEVNIFELFFVDREASGE